MIKQAEMLAAFKFFGGSHKPVHLQIGSAQEVIEPPCALNTVGVALGVP